MAINHPKLAKKSKAQEKPPSMWSRITERIPLYTKLKGGKRLIESLITGGGIPLYVRFTGGTLGKKRDRAAYFKKLYDETMTKLNKERKYPLSREEAAILQARAARHRTEYYRLRETNNK